MAWYFEPADRVVDSGIVRDAIGLRANPVVGAEVDKVAVRQQEIAQDYQPARINYQAARSPLDREKWYRALGRHAFDSFLKSQREQSKPGHAKRKKYRRSLS